MEFPTPEVPAVAQPTLARVASTLRASARRTADVPDADHDLLARFVRHRDEAAFRHLVNRHAKTVLAACRQVLSDPADIDDTFQATFLVLLKKAKAVDATTPLTGWLFAVAHRLAVRCRADRTRRQTREAEAARRTRTTTADDLSWREAAALLHAELNALPDRYRRPLLLCSVQGLTRDEAAEQLGTTVGAVRGQLERGRTLLERRLAKRGVVLSAGLLAVLMGSSRAAGGPPAELIDLAVSAAGGNASSTAVALAHGAFPMTANLKPAILPAVLAVGLVWAGIGLGTPATADEKPAQEMKKPAADAKAEPKKADAAKERTISGTVLGHDGQPVAAELQLVWQDAEPQPLGKTAADGTFKVTVPMKRGEYGGWLVATAAGHGPEFVAHGLDYSPKTLTPTLDVTLRLPKGRAIKGRLIDQQGKAVAGATVKATALSACDTAAAMDARLKRWAEEAFHGSAPSGDRGLHFADKPQAADNPGGQTPYTAVTDKDGRFELTGLGSGQLVTLRLRGAGVADAEVLTLNRDGFDPEPVNKRVRTSEFRSFSGRWTLAGPDPAVVMSQEKVVRGTVTDPAGKPRAGVRVWLSRTNRHDLNADHNVATTDTDGRYEIRGARKHAGYMVEVPPDTAAGLLPCQGFADDTVGYEPITIDLKQAKGVVVTGKVTNKATGEPVHCSMYPQVMANNPFVDKFPPFMNAAALGCEQYHTDKAGRYRVVVIPGRVLLSASPQRAGRAEFKPLAPDPKFSDQFAAADGTLLFNAFGGGQAHVQGCWCQVVEAKEGDTELTVDAALEPATRTPVRVADADGKPVTGVSATGVTHIEFEHANEVVGPLVVFNLEAKKERVLAVAHKGRKLVGTLKLTADTKDPLVTLGGGGGVTGRVVDGAGQPVEGVTVKLHFDRREVAEAFEVIAPASPVTTDAKGHFRFDTLPPGWQFRFTFSKGAKRFGPDYDKAPKFQTEKHGELKELGDMKLDSAKDGE